ncbi:unnamed protein product [Lactuca saligna]|uniref:Uncharacterized protein n=1 Tax=Lactuca saligna TaxID=75948 RepID=A0AA35ZSU3_LACSI|nr:unnamed protein product [Lactuca saligna]
MIFKVKTLFSILFIIILEASMAGSLETTSFVDQSTSIVILNIKPSQNLILDMESSRYHEILRTSINKAHFCKILGLASFEGLVDLESASNNALIEMFHQIGYIRDISLLSKSRKPFLPPVWNRLFTFLFKSFSECVAGFDNASKLFYTIIYSLYHDINLDYGSILWT